MAGGGSDASRSDAARLRAESDRNRIDFLRVELSLSSTFAGMAETYCRLQRWEQARRCLRHAEDAYSTLVRFLSESRHSTHICERQRRELAMRMGPLRGTLDWLNDRI